MSGVCCEDDIFEAIFTEYYDTVYKYVLISLNFDNTAADDCMQDICEKLLEKNDILIKHPNPGGFFVVTAKNYIKKYKTSYAKTLKHIVAIDENAEKFIYEENFDELLEEHIDVEKLKKEILSRLNNKEIALYIMFYENRRSILEIASCLRISENNVKVRLFRLRLKVKVMVKEVFFQQDWKEGGSYENS